MANNYTIKSLFILIFCGISLSLFSQKTFIERADISVNENGKQFLNPWIGGLNNPQFSAADLNNNGVDDLVVFDKTGDKLLTFINNGTPNQVDYVYAPEFESRFPIFETDTPRVKHWMLMEDFNCDGVLDIFASTPGQIDLHLGSFNGNNEISFEYQSFLEFKSNSGLINIFVTATDIPAIVDVNSDGDLDILTFALTGGVLEYYENQSQELTGTCGDTMLFEFVDDCWGDFFEGAITKSVTLLDSCGQLVGPCQFCKNDGRGGGPRHSGSTVLAFDEDGDGDKEVILGDISFNCLNRVLNGGNKDSAKVISQDTTFPKYNVPYDVPLFPASFYVDVNNDGERDLLVAPNVERAAENYTGIWYYQGSNVNDTISFEHKTDTFMLDKAIDLGEGAYPAFFDYNNDDLLDLVVGNFGYYINGVVYKSGLALFENVGTTTDPEFELVDRDFANISALGLDAITPTFGDLDDDGDKDLIIGESEGWIHYLKNIAPIGNTANFQLEVAKFFKLDVGNFSAPLLYDVNGDGLLDLIIGEKSGNLNYFENFGKRIAPEYNDSIPGRFNNFFGNVDVKVPGLFDRGYSTPVITPLDSTGKLYLVVGSDEGQLRLYDFDPNLALGGTFKKIENKFSNIDDGERLAPAIADLSLDGDYELITGNYRGGLSAYTQKGSPLVSVGELTLKENELLIFPNPTNDQLNIEFLNPQVIGMVRNIQIEVYDLLGRKVIDHGYSDGFGSRRITMDVSKLHTGVYFVSILLNDQQPFTQKVIIK